MVAASYVTKRVLFSTGKALWIAGTHALSRNDSLLSKVALQSPPPPAAAAARSPYRRAPPECNAAPSRRPRPLPSLLISRAATSLLVLLVPLIVEMDREQQARRARARSFDSRPSSARGAPLQFSARGGEVALPPIATPSFLG